MQIHQIPQLRRPVMIMAFTGWSDAGEAASAALEHLLTAWEQEPDALSIQLIATMDSEEFYDFQVNRPHVFTDSNDVRALTWPTTQIFSVKLPHLDSDLVLVKGAEPSMRWKTFAGQLLDLADDLEVSMVLTLGSLLADVPHSRPTTVNITAASGALAAKLDAEVSSYEGPTGILGVIHDGALARSIDSISLWAPVPHYASNTPSPKISLALVRALEDFLQISIPQDDLEISADSWKLDIDELAKSDNDVADYVRKLEELKDAQDIPEMSGDIIAKEFERYLRRKTKD
ncbi:MAG: PAC2 family protein [Actinobacteria bacterium]|nr:PAC2 family protein [Actinomycetota bacterium]MTA58197.1 PAC2 family protein [Actinomycetota bacterium]